MGHLRRLKDEYRALVDRLDRGTMALPEPADAGAWQGWREILEILYTPEEAALAAKLPARPTSLGKLALRLGLPEAELATRLDAMCDKGLVMDLVHSRTGERAYLLSPPVVGFFEFSLMRAKDSIPKKRMAEALHAYTHGDVTFAREAFGRETVIARALVHESALADDPLPDVLDWERAAEVVGGASGWAVSLCYCRHKAEHVGEACGAEMENCLSLNRGAEFVVRRGFGRAIPREEALDVVARARAAGLVQLPDNVMHRPTFVQLLRLLLRTAPRREHLWPPGGEPERVPAAPGRWALRGVLALRARLSGGSHRDGAAARDRRAEERARPPARRGALHRVRRLRRCLPQGGAAHGPIRRAAARSGQLVEKAVRMALERNRLAELLFDEGAGLGSRFLHHAVDAIVRLPPAKALLATEQVRSRFVKWALARFRGLA